jgi:hypothetical protein
MNTPKISPDEQITANAVSQIDPFARNDRPSPVLNQHIKVKQRDFSKYNDPEIKNMPKKEIKKRGRKPKQALEEMPVEIPTIETKEIHESRSTEGMPSYRCEFGGRDVFVGFLAYKSTNPVTAMVLTALALDFGKDKIRFDLECGNSMIYQARNNLAKKFLETDARWMLMLDDDMIPCIGRPSWMRHWVTSAREVLDLPLQRHIIHRLVNANKTVVGAAYFERRELTPPRLVCSDQSIMPRAKAYEDSIVEVDWLGTGAMLVHRKVFEDISAIYPEIDGNYFHPIDGKTGEDISFCIRAKKAGHSTWVDLGVPTFHVGNKTY